LNPKERCVSFVKDGVFVPGSGHGSATSPGTDKPEEGVIASERWNNLFLPLYGPRDQRCFRNKTPSSFSDTWEAATSD
jgi:hypothetical protein